MKTKNEHGLYSVDLSAEDAGVLLELVKEIDLRPMTIPQIAAFSKLWAHLELIEEAEKEITNVAK